MKVQLVVSPAARDDIESIVEYLAREAGPDISAKYRRELLRIIALLRDYPGLGSSRPKLGRGVRLSVVAPYLLLYRYVDGTVAVLRILHGSRKIVPALVGRDT